MILLQQTLETAFQQLSDVFLGQETPAAVLMAHGPKSLIAVSINFHTSWLTLSKYDIHAVHFFYVFIYVYNFPKNTSLTSVSSIH